MCIIVYWLWPSFIVKSSGVKVVENSAPRVWTLYSCIEGIQWSILAGVILLMCKAHKLGIVLVLTSPKRLYYFHCIFCARALNLWLTGPADLSVTGVESLLLLDMSLVFCPQGH